MGEQKRNNIGQSRSFEGLEDKADQDIAIGRPTRLLRNTGNLNLAPKFIPVLSPLKLKNPNNQLVIKSFFFKKPLQTLMQLEVIISVFIN